VSECEFAQKSDSTAKSINDMLVALLCRHGNIFLMPAG
jgi:hypothetical protein